MTLTKLNYMYTKADTLLGIFTNICIDVIWNLTRYTSNYTTAERYKQVIVLSVKYSVQII